MFALPLGVTETLPGKALTFANRSDRQSQSGDDRVALTGVFKLPLKLHVTDPASRAPEHPRPHCVLWRPAQHRVPVQASPHSLEAKVLTAILEADGKSSAPNRGG